MKKLILLFLLIFLLPAYKLRAQTGLEVSPAFNEVIIKPGAKIEGSFTLKNNNEFDLSLEIIKGIQDSEGIVSLESSESEDWVEIELNRFTLASLKSKEFKYVLSVPVGVEEGVYQPMVIFKVADSISEEGTTTGITQLLPFQFRIFVSENAVYNADLKVRDLSVTNNIVFSNNQTINYAVENISPSPSKPLLRVQVVSPDGQIIFQSVENENLAVLLKDKTIGKALNITESFNDSSQFGRYRVELLISDSLTQKSVVEKVYFIYIPSKIIIAILIIILIVVALFFFIYRMKHRHKKAKKEEHVFMYK